MKKAGGHVAACRVDQFEGHPVRTQGVRPAEAGHEHGLLLGFVGHHFNGGGQRGGRRRIGHEQLPGRERAEHFRGQGEHFFPGNIAEDGEHAVFGRDAGVAEGEQLGAGQSLDRFRGAVRAQPVRMVPEHGTAHGVARDRGDLFVLRFDRGNLVFLLAGDFLLGESRMDQHVGQNVHAEPQVGFHHLDRNTEAVVPGVGADLSAHRFDLIVELLAVTAGRAFDQSAGGQGGDAIGPGRFGEKTAAEDGDEVDQREFAVLADQHAQSVWQGEVFDSARAPRGGLFDRAVQGTFGIERGDGGL